ncbi:MAG TPA: nicotinate phosphoribosyltransferase [Bacteroidetes bacterium]|nr:nicotinate phosphoribosyltransferase [Bacteroidota bacterium]
MNPCNTSSYPALYTDLYELTMAEGYYFSGKYGQDAVFDYFFRRNPYEGGYTVFCGLSGLLEQLENFRFPPESLEYLLSKGFRKEFLDYLSGFRFTGNVWSVEEGEIVFPNEMILRVEGNILETQLIETLVLNILNFESLIATKASRIRRVAGDRMVMDFGLRRAQGMAGLQASRAAYIGGVDSTSNVLAGYLYGIPVSGTQAHSWVQSFDSELEAFREYARVHPNRAVLLVDTYDTLASGIPNALTVAAEMKKDGKKLAGIRLDSGDLAYLSRKAREMLDGEGFPDVKIFASNQLDEYTIQSLNQQEAPIDGFGVGTKLITGKESAALDGVYKLSYRNGAPWMKISENLEKVTLPGIKKLVRCFDEEGRMTADALTLELEGEVEEIFHPVQIGKHCRITQYEQKCLLHPFMQNGKRAKKFPPIEQIRDAVRIKLGKLPAEHQRFENPHIYRVGISGELMKLRDELVKKLNSTRKIH